MIVNGNLIDERDALDRLKEFYRLTAEADRLESEIAALEQKAKTARSEAERLRRGLVGV